MHVCSEEYKKYEDCIVGDFSEEEESSDDEDEED